MLASLRKAAVLGLVTTLCGYALIPILASAQEIPEPEEGKALIIFLRPSKRAKGIKSSVFDITSGKNEVIGIASGRTKLAYSTDPGEHLFMVIGESADFMKADLEAGKTYFSTIRVRMGAWKARFSLLPVRQADLDGEEFQEWNSRSSLIENREKSVVWAEKHANSIAKKRAKYFKKWEEKSDTEKAEVTLLKEDGR